MDDTQRLPSDDEEGDLSVDKDKPVGNLHMFAGVYGPVQDFPIYPGQNVIGRHHSCDITLPAQSVSKRHAILEVTGDCHTIRDHNSLNKTRRNKVALNPHVRYALSDGEFLLFADVACRYTFVKRLETETSAIEESEDDSMLVPGTQATLAIEKTPAAAIRRIGLGAVLAMDSGDEEEEENKAQKSWSDGGEGGSRDAQRASESGPISPPITDTIVPESDEEVDMSTSETPLPSFHLHCDSDTDNHETSRRSSFIPSSLNTVPSSPVKETEKQESGRLSSVNKDESLHRSAEKETTEKDTSDVSEAKKDTTDAVADDGISSSSGDDQDIADAELKDNGNRDNRNLEDTENNAEQSKILNVTLPRSPRVKGSEDETSGDTVPTAATETDLDHDANAEECNFALVERGKVEVDFCLDSDTDVDEDDIVTSKSDIKKSDTTETKSKEDPEQIGISVAISDIANVDEKEKVTSGAVLQQVKVGEITIDSDTDVKENTKAANIGNVATKTENDVSLADGTVDGLLLSKVTSGHDLADPSTIIQENKEDLHVDSDTDVEDADTTRSDVANVKPVDSSTIIQGKKEEFHVDSDTDVEDADTTRSDVANVEPVDSSTIIQENKEDLHVDSDTDVEDADTTRSDVGNADPVDSNKISQEKKEDFHVDSDTDVEDADTTRSDVANVEPVDSNKISQENKEDFHVDSDTDVEDADTTRSDVGNAEPIDSSKISQENKEDFHVDSDTDVEDVGVSSTEVRQYLDSKPKDILVKDTKEAINLDSDTDVEEDVNASSTEVAKEKEDSKTNEPEVKEDLHMVSDMDVEEDVNVSSTEVAKEKEEPKTVDKKVKEDLHLDSDTDVEDDDQAPGSSSALPKTGIGELKTETIKFDKADHKNAAVLILDSDTDEDDEISAGAGMEKSEEHEVSEENPIDKKEPVAANEAAALHTDSNTEVDEDDGAAELDETQAPEVDLLSTDVSSKEEGKLENASVSSGSETSSAVNVSGVEVPNVVAQGRSSEEETPKTDSEGPDFEMMATQCYLEPPEPESDLPEEEEATQAYILSSTWAEPDPFKRPSDPIGVLQISAVSLDKSEEEDTDEDAVAETQLFCLDAGQSVGPEVQESPQIQKETVEIQETPERAVPGSSKDVKESPQGVMCEEDTQPVSQCLSKPLEERGTWLRLKRDVPASVWVKSLHQERETSNVDEDATQVDESTEDEQDVPRLELEATQSFITEDPAVQERATKDQTPSLSVVEEDDTGPMVSAVPPTEIRPIEPSNVDTQATDASTQAYSLNLDSNAPQQDMQIPPNTDATQSNSPSLPTTSENAPQPSLQLPSANEDTQADSPSPPGSCDNVPNQGLQLPYVGDARQVDALQEDLKVPSTEDSTSANKGSLPELAAHAPEPNLQVPSSDDATQPIMEDTEADNTQPARETASAPGAKVTAKGKMPSRRGLNRRRKEEPAKNELPTDEGDEIPKEAPQAADSVSEKRAEPSAGDSDQPGPSETKEDLEQEKGGRRRGGRRKAAVEEESKTLTKEELVGQTGSRKRTNRTASVDEPSLSGFDEKVGRKQPSRKSIAKVTGEEKTDDLKEEPSSSSKNNVVEVNEDGVNKNHENHNLPSMGPSETEGKVTSVSTTETASEEDHIPESLGTSQGKKPVRNRRRVATIIKNDNAGSAKFKEDIDDSDIQSENQSDVSTQPPTKSDSQDGGQEDGLRNRTRTCRVPAGESICKNKDEETRGKKEDVPCAKSQRLQRNLKEQEKEDPQSTRQASKRGKGTRDDQKDKDYLEGSSSNISPKRSRRHSKEDDAKPKQEVTKAEKNEEDDTTQEFTGTENSVTEDQNDANTGKRARRGCSKQVLDQKETVKENVNTRARRISKSEEVIQSEDQSKRTVRSRNRSKEEIKPADVSKEDTSGQAGSRRTKKNVKDDGEHMGEHKPNEKPPEAEKTLPRTRRNVNEKEQMGDEHVTKTSPADTSIKAEQTPSKTRRSNRLTESTEESSKAVAFSSRTRRKVSENEVEKTIEPKPTEESSQSERSSTRTRRKVKEKEEPEKDLESDTKPSEESPQSSTRTRRKVKENEEPEKDLKTETKPSEVSPQSERSSTRTRRKVKQNNEPENDTETEPKPSEESPQSSTRTRRKVKNEELNMHPVPEPKLTGECSQAERSSSRTRRKVKENEEPEKDLESRPSEESSQSERSSSRTKRKTSTEDDEKTDDKSKIKEKNDEEAKKSRRGATNKEELPQFSTPVASRKRGRPSKADTESKREKSDETLEEEAEPVLPANRRGRGKRTPSEDAQPEGADRKEVSTPEPSPSRRKSSALSNLADIRTPRRTNRLSTAALTTSPYVTPSAAMPKVLFTGVVDSAGEEIIRSLGGDIADSVFDCTHLITDRVRRTVKFLCALARGIPIITLDWIDKCKKSNCFLSPAGFLVNDKEQEKNFNFVLSESLQKAKRRPLLEGYEIHVTPSVKPEPEHMKDIIRCSGATYLPKMPRSFKDKCVIVSCPEDAARCKSVPAKTPITTAEFILSGILRQEVSPAAYLLNPAGQDAAPTPAKRRR